MKNPLPNFQLWLKSLTFFLLHSLFSIRYSLFFFISLLVLPFGIVRFFLLHSSFSIRYSLFFFISLLVLPFAPSFVSAQTRFSTAADSLLILLKTDRQDTSKINHLNALGWELKNLNPDTSIILGNQALELLRDIYQSANEKKRKLGALLTQTLGNLGVYYYFKADYPNALINYFKALKIADALNNKNSMAKLLGNIGNVYSDKGEYLKALDYYIKSIKMKEETGNKKGVSNNLGNIGSVYKEQGDYPKALDYYFKALKLDKESGNKNEIAIWLLNIGSVYDYQGEYHKALNYYFKGLKLAEELGNKSLIAILLGNIGIVYHKQKNFPTAHDYFLKSLKINEALGNKNGVSRDLTKLGIFYDEQKDFIKAQEFYSKALKIAEEIVDSSHMAMIFGNMGSLNTFTGKFKEAESYLKKSILIDSCINNKFDQMISTENLSFLYDTLGQLDKNNVSVNYYKLALEHYKKAAALKDTIFNEEKAKDIGRLEQKHEYEMAELKRQQEEKERSRQSAVALSRRNTLEYSAILLGIFALFVIVFFVARFNLPPWAVELAVFIPFLILFEFVLVLLDPYIDSVTGGEPVWKLLVNALLAAVIFPIHGFFERMLKKRVGGSHSPEASD